MNADVQLNLALILFLPWYSILAGLYWFYPRQPRTLTRWSFDVAALTATTLLSAASMQWGYLHADVSAGPMWKQILATSVCYGVFLAAMTAAFYLRRAWIIRPYDRRSQNDITPNLPQVNS
ncbi:hypothetical protein [Lysobacter claricitrinus]|uniref:hypothetical protein n=1 Tax=Lysobacter claricitrinus TaxID=3367728 RepID=UPI0037DABA4E